MTAGQRIQQARKKVGLSQKQLGERLGLSASMIGQWENDLRNPKYETCQRIADALGIDILYLLTSEEMDRGILDLIKADYDSDDAFYQDFIEKKVFLMLLNGDIDQRLMMAYCSLNSEGQKKAVERIEELAEIPRYRAETAPHPFASQSEGTDNTPSPDVPEAPPEGE